MHKTLKNHFPIIRDRMELKMEIYEREELRTVFESWLPERRKEFLDFCTGVRGIKFLYDSFFKEILSPEYAKDRLESLLSLLLGMEVKILAALPPDSTRIADESSLLIMDIVVQLGDGTIVNLEVQKIGYKFPGERSACYSADLLLRQYKRIRSEQKRKKQGFSYKNIKGVYTIVLFEHSPKEFHEFRNTYLHYFEQVSNTGLTLNLLQKYLFIPLDIFKEKQHNEGNRIKNKLEAWLTFLSVDDPEIILRLIEEYPEFKVMYEDAYSLCLNIEEVMQMFSKELADLDRNTVQLMIDEMQEEINSQKEAINHQKKQLEIQDREIKNAQAEKYQMMERLCQSVGDIEKAAGLLGVSVDEIRSVLGYNA